MNRKITTIIVISLVIFIFLLVWFLNFGKELFKQNTNFNTDSLPTPTETIIINDNSDIDRELEDLDKSMDDALKQDDSTDPTTGL